MNINIFELIVKTIIAGIDLALISFVFWLVTILLKTQFTFDVPIVIWLVYELVRRWED